jgi:hypothetical protein
MSLLLKKVMNLNFCLVAIIVLCIYSSLVSVSKLKANYSKNERSISNKAIKNEPDEKRGFDEILLSKNNGNQPLSGRGLRETIKAAPDSSQLTTSYDSFGNKTEVRVFNNHQRLKLLMLRTSVNGQKQVYVYGQNGEVEGLPEHMLDKATTASADEIASLAGITQNRQEKDHSSYAQTNQSITPITPAPTYQFPIQEQSNEAVVTDEKTKSKSSEDNYDKEIPLPKENSYPVNTQTDTLNRQP